MSDVIGIYFGGEENGIARATALFGSWEFVPRILVEALLRFDEAWKVSRTWALRAEAKAEERARDRKKVIERVIESGESERSDG